MPLHDRDPQVVATKYRARKIGEGQFELYAAQESAPRISVQRQGAFLHLKAVPEAVLWRTSEADNPFYAVHLLIDDMSIGHSGDEGWSSSLVDNCLFVIDGESLRYIPLTNIRIVAESQFHIEKKQLAAMKGEMPPSDPAPNATPDRPFAYARVVHCPAVSEFGSRESFECTVGLPQKTFEQLLKGCLSGRVMTACFHGIGGALSASFQYGAARDLIVLAGAGFDISIDSVTLEYHCKFESPVQRGVVTEEKPRDASETERLLPTLHHVAVGIETLRSTVIKAAWIVAVAFLIVTVIK